MGHFRFVADLFICRIVQRYRYIHIQEHYCLEDTDIFIYLLTVLHALNVIKYSSYNVIQNKAIAIMALFI